jgi:hypothetical protein
MFEQNQSGSLGAVISGQTHMTKLEQVPEFFSKKELSRLKQTVGTAIVFVL